MGVVLQVSPAAFYIWPTMLHQYAIHRSCAASTSELFVDVLIRCMQPAEGCQSQKAVEDRLSKQSLDLLNMAW